MKSVVSATIFFATLLVLALVPSGRTHAADAGLVAHWTLDDGVGLTATDATSTNDGTLTNGPVWASGQIDGALDLDGTDDYIAAPDMGTVEAYPFSFSAWFNTSSADPTMAIISQNDNVGGVERAQLYFTGGLLRWNVRSSAEVEIGNATNYRDGSWHHVVGVSRSSTDHELYIDGVSVSTSATDVPALTVNETSIGRWNSALGYYFDGLLDDVRVYQRGLDDMEVSALYNVASSGVTVVESSGSTEATEGGATDTFDVVLDSEPTGPVDVVFSTTAEATTSVAVASFSTITWNATQTVTISAVDDDVDDDTTMATTTIVASSTYADYDGATATSVVTTITDNDTAGVTVTESGGSTTVTEGAATDTVSVILDSEPTADVTISLSTTAEATSSASVLTFTAMTWDATQTVSIIATDDAVVDGTTTATTTFITSSADPNYDGTATSTVVATVVDDDVAAAPTPSPSSSDSRERSRGGGSVESTGGSGAFGPAATGEAAERAALEEAIRGLLIRIIEMLQAQIAALRV